MKNPDTQGKPRSAQGNGKARSNRSDVNARNVARIRTAAAIVRHRQEWLYDRLADRFRTAFLESVVKSRESVDVAAERARQQLTYAKCQSALHFKQTGTVPPCPSCLGTQFHKGY